ncbi:SPOR domain-containing protein [Lachnospiraceae bacterium OttesenSCG-928-E19]|nr:SPOR domain-containing protein [Lachnospiraceae bacterium OttesenSCG-928-E19]
MNNELDDSLDLLDLEDDEVLETLPETSPFAAPRPKKPWLLMGVGLLVIVLATYIIIRAIGTDDSSSIEIDLDVPEVVTVDPTDSDTLVIPVTGTTPATVVTPAPKPQPKPAPVAKPEPVATPGVPVREVNDRKDVTFNPNKAPTTAPVKATKPKVEPKAKPAATSNWYVQFGSYSTRAAAEAAQKKIRAGHSSLFAGKQFVILAAQLPNGTTTYRLRVGFATSNDANNFCQNAKSDGLDCYVAK